MTLRDVIQLALDEVDFPDGQILAYAAALRARLVELAPRGTSADVCTRPVGPVGLASRPQQLLIDLRLGDLRVNQEIDLP